MPARIIENKADADASALIVAAPSRKRNSLRTLLRAVPQITIIDLVDDVSSVLESNGDHSPDLLVLDLSLSVNGIWTMLEQIRAEWPQTRCIVLVETIQQRQMAQEANVDGVLFNGFSTDKFFALVERLLPRGDSSTIRDDTLL
jgi:DNA-binding NarL/FixJ family response regulator